MHFRRARQVGLQGVGLDDISVSGSRRPTSRGREICGQCRRLPRHARRRKEGRWMRVTSVSVDKHKQTISVAIAKPHGNGGCRGFGTIGEITERIGELTAKPSQRHGTGPFG